MQEDRGDGKDNRQEQTPKMAPKPTHCEGVPVQMLVSMPDARVSLSEVMTRLGGMAGFATAATGVGICKLPPQSLHVIMQPTASGGAL